MWLLKALIEDACLASVERLFQHCDPLSEKHFCPLAGLFKGSLKSVLVSRRLCIALTAFLVKISLRYSGAMPCRHLKTVMFTCLLINCSIGSEVCLEHQNCYSSQYVLLCFGGSAIVRCQWNYSSPKQNSSTGSEAQLYYYRGS